MWSWRGIFWVIAAFGCLSLAGWFVLPETLPPERRSRKPLSHAISIYAGLVRNPILLGYALSGGFFFGGIYAYLADTPFVYIRFYHVSTAHYGLLFAVNIVGTMAIHIVNRRMVLKVGSDRLFKIGACASAISGIILAINTWTGFGGLVDIVVPLCCYVSMLAFIVPNSVAGALSGFPDRAGAASGFLGLVHYGTGIISAAMVGWFADGTPWTMGWVIALGGIGSFVFAAALVRSAAPNSAAAGSQGIAAPLEIHAEVSLKGAAAIARIQ